MCVCVSRAMCAVESMGGCCSCNSANSSYFPPYSSTLFPPPGLTNNEYGVLTTYVPNFDQLHLNLNGRYEVPQICKVLYTKPENMVRNEQATNCIWLSKPKLTSSWAAGFSFNKCHADLKAPYDPHLPSLFDGEEYSKYARMWTRYVNPSLFLHPIISPVLLFLPHPSPYPTLDGVLLHYLKSHFPFYSLPPHPHFYALPLPQWLRHLHAAPKHRLSRLHTRSTNQGR